MRRYLIVDDNVAFAENLAEILRDEGEEAVVVSGGDQAIEAARKTRFDALVTDMRMPVMNVARLVHEIRAVDHGLPAIVITAYSGEDDLTAARAEGLLAVLPKPAPIPRLIELLRLARRAGSSPSSRTIPRWRTISPGATRPRVLRRDRSFARKREGSAA
jgi:CheY-like chemotaxis protein